MRPKKGVSDTADALDDGVEAVETVSLSGPENAGGFSFESVEYPAGEDGFISVPTGVPNLIETASIHGFRIAAQPAVKDEK